MSLWLFRFLLLLAIIVDVAMIAMWAMGLYLFILVTGSAMDADAQQWAWSGGVSLIALTALIGLSIFGIIKGWKLSEGRQFGKATWWIVVPMLLQLAVMGLL